MSTLYAALQSDNNNNFDIRVVNFLVGMFASDQRSGTLDLSEFREMWNYVDQWKGIFEKAKKGTPMTVDRFQPALDAMGFV